MKKLIIILIIFTSCASVKEHRYTQKEVNTIIDSIKVNNKTKEKDSVVTYKYKTITKPVETIIKIPIECDSLGKIKDLEYEIKSGKNSFKAILRDNKLSFDARLDSTVNSLNKRYQNKFKQDSITIEQRLKEKYERQTDQTIVKKEPWYKTNLKLYIIIILESLVIGLLTYLLIRRK